MKRIICCVVILTLILAGCTTQKTTLHKEHNKKPVPTVTQVDESANSKAPTAQPLETKENKTEVFDTYAQKYEAENRFEDLYIPAKCWLLGDENIVEVISLGNVDNVTVIKQSSVERVEHSTVMNFCNATVFDKTGKSISIMLSQEETDKLLELIDKD